MNTNNPFIVEAVRASLGDVYLVGGAVRDSLIGRETTDDFDFTTPLIPKEIVKKLNNDGYKTIENFAKFGTISTVISKTKVEITTFRNEKYSNGSRKPDVEFGKSLQDDLSRRDFTINAIAHDGKKFIDPFNGQEDIRNKKIRSVGNPIDRFNEDPLRMLRAFRFMSTLNFTMENDTFDAIYNNAQKINIVSGERISEELDKLICGESWVRTVSLCLETEIFENIFDVQKTDKYKDLFIEILSNQDHEGVANDRCSRWVSIIKTVISVINQKNHHLSYSRLLNTCFDKFRQTLKWSKDTSNNIFERLEKESQQDSLLLLEEDYIRSKNENDDRQYVFKEKMLRIKMRQSFVNHKFKQSADIAYELVKTQDIVFDTRIKSGTDSAWLIRDVYPYYLDSLKYICAWEVRQFCPVNTKQDIQATINKILHDNKIFKLANFSISQDDRAYVIEKSLLMILDLAGEKISTLTNAEILEYNTTIPRNHERIEKIKRQYLNQLINLRKPPYEEGTSEKRARLNKKVAELHLELHDGIKDLEYNSYLIDYFKWSALSTNSIDIFFDNLEEMNQIIDAVIEDPILNSNYNLGSQYLDNANCLIYGLTLTTDIDEKISLVRNIIANYKLVSMGTNRNIARYQLLLEWLTTANKIIKSDLIESKNILNNLPNLKSYHYQDIDEDFVAINMKEIGKIRNNMYDIESLLLQLHGRKSEKTIFSLNIKSLSRLIHGDIIEDDLAYEIFKNILKLKISKDITIEPVSIQNNIISDEQDNLINENIKLISDGEGKNVEFKESWSYDVKNKEVDPTKTVLNSALRAIVSFMNSGGGKLFIGVHDSGIVTGLEVADFALQKKQNLNNLELQDKLKLLIDHNIFKAVGKINATLVRTSFDKFENKTFAIIDVEPSRNGLVFLDHKCYVRFNANCQELNTEELYDYVKKQDFEIESEKIA